MRRNFIRIDRRIPASGRASKDLKDTTRFWLPNHELLFASQSSSGIVSYTTNQDSFVAGPIRPILEKTTAIPFGLPILMPDGKRFVAVMQAAGTPVALQTQVSFLLNFPDELERRDSAGTLK